MGNNPSSQQGQSGGQGQGSDAPRRSGSQRRHQDGSTNTSRPAPSSSRPPNLPPLPHHRPSPTTAAAGSSASPAGSGIASPPLTSPSSIRPGAHSPRRRKSLELPDLNRLGLTTTTSGAAAEQLGEGGGITTVSVNESAVDSAENMVGQRRGVSGMGRTLSPLGATMGGPMTSPAVPIPGSSTTTNNASSSSAATSSRPEINPYFPTNIGGGQSSTSSRPSAAGSGGSGVVPPTPGLPNYSHSPVPEPRIHSQATQSGNNDSNSTLPTPIGQHGDSSPALAGMAPTIIHTEDVTQPDAQAGLAVPSTSIAASLPPIGASRMPTSPARPPQQGLPPLGPSENAKAAEGMLLSSLPKGVSPVNHTNEVGAKTADVAQQPPPPTTVPTLVTWSGGGKDVYVTGTFAERGWKERLKMNKSAQDFSLMLDLPPGIHRLKFIVDDHWRCSNLMQTATDGDGNLVNWVQVEAPRKQESDWQMAEWARKVNDNVVDQDDGEWTKDIPPALINFQAVEERALSDPPEQLRGSQLQHFRRQQSALLQIVPSPPTLPRHLEKVILNSTPKELEGTVGGAAGDDNSILPVPNHVVLNHLTASAIRNGTLAVGTTTRYKRKYISTIYFKPVDPIPRD